MNATARITVEQGARGWFAVLVDDGGPIRTGMGSYRSRHNAVQEAREWAQAEGYKLAADIDTAPSGPGQPRRKP